jgi:ribosomal protein S18 acetylase RimI-like enzyme
MPVDDIKIVPITLGDFQFGYDIRKLTMEEHIRKAYGEWNEVKQMESCKKHFSLEHRFVIKYLDKKIGWLMFEENETNIDLCKIFIHSKFQGKGIGSKIINNLIIIVKDKNKVIILDVLKSNYRAKEFYLKLGFKIYNETEHEYYFKYAIN